MGRSENLKGHAEYGGHNLFHLVEIWLTDLQKNGEGRCPSSPLVATPLFSLAELLVLHSGAKQFLIKHFLCLTDVKLVEKKSRFKRISKFFEIRIFLRITFLTAIIAQRVQGIHLYIYIYIYDIPMIPKNLI